MRAGRVGQEAFGDNICLSEESDFLQLPVELISLILSQLTIHDLGLLTQVNRCIHELVDGDLLWKWRCNEYHPSAIQQIRDHYSVDSWKETYHRLIEATSKAYDRLKKYYADMFYHEYHQYNSRTFVRDDIRDEAFDQFIIAVSASRGHDWLSRVDRQWNRESLNELMVDPDQLDLNDGQEDEKFSQALCKLSTHHCKLFAAAATGNTASMHHLLKMRKPNLNDIFNFNQFEQWYRYYFFHHDNDCHPLWIFPDKRQLMMGPLVPNEPSLVDFACFYKQQSLLDVYFQMALEKAPREEWLFWAIICQQSQATVRQMLDDGIDVNQKKSPSKILGIMFGVYPLHIAALWGDREVVRLLIQRGAKFNLSYWEKLSLMFFLLQNKQYDMAVELIDQGVDLYGMDKKSLFMLMEGDVENLLASVDLDEKCKAIAVKIFSFAFHIAFSNDDVASIELLEKFDPVNSHDYLKNQNCLYNAAFAQREEMLVFIMKYRLKTQHNDDSFLKELIEYAICFEDITILHKAFDLGLDVSSWSRSFLLATIQRIDFRMHSEVSHQVHDLLLDEFKRQRLSMSAWHQATSISFWGNNMKDQLNELGERMEYKGCVLF